MQYYQHLCSYRLHNVHVGCVLYRALVFKCNLKELQVYSSESLILLCIVRSGHLELVKYLIEVLRCSARCTNFLKQTPLHYACWWVIICQSILNVQELQIIVIWINFHLYCCRVFLKYFWQCIHYYYFKYQLILEVRCGHKLLSNGALNLLISVKPLAMAQWFVDSTDYIHEMINYWWCWVAGWQAKFF